MLHFNQSATTTVTLTLGDKVSIDDNSIYLFDFLNLENNRDYCFIGIDSSTAQTFYNTFSITLTGTSYQNLTAGTVHLDNGQYNYYVYEQTGYTLDVSASTKLVESGMARVWPVDYLPKTYYSGQTLNKTINYQI